MGDSIHANCWIYKTVESSNWKIISASIKNILLNPSLLATTDGLDYHSNHRNTNTIQSFKYKQKNKSMFVPKIYML